MSSEVQYEQLEGPAQHTAGQGQAGADLRRLRDVPVQLTVEIGRATMTVGDTLELRPGSVYALPQETFHQHFNIGADPARYLALRAGGRKFVRPWGAKMYGVDESVAAGGDQIEYQDEDPKIRRMFEQELAKRGVVSRMNAVIAAA